MNPLQHHPSTHTLVTPAHVSYTTSRRARDALAALRRLPRTARAHDPRVAHRGPRSPRSPRTLCTRTKPRHKSTCSPSSSTRRTRLAHAGLAKSTQPRRPCRRPSSQRRTRGPHVPRAPCMRPSEPRTTTPQYPNHTTTTLSRQPHHHPLNRKSPPKNLVTPGQRGWSLVQ